MAFSRISLAVFIASFAISACSANTASTSQDQSAESVEKTETYACSKASYYADSLAGNATASGEIYDPAKLTAAHKTLPFGTVLKVVRDGYGDVMVTVNDRGPFIEGREIDLSRAAAAKLDMIRDGVADVCIYRVE